MNQTEQVTSITPLEAAAKAIFSLQKQVAEQAERIEKLWDTVIEHAEHIEKLERRVASLAAEAVPNLSVASVELKERIERLEAALRDVTSCLTTGKASKDMRAKGEGHSHLILDAKSVQAIGEICHRLKE